jgi:signal peptidase II
MLKNKYIFGFVAMDLLILDQVSKWFVFKSDFFDYILNKEIAFSIPVSGWMLVPLYGIAFSFLISFFKTSLNKESRLGWFFCSLVLAGALGNLIDRFTYGGVVDFIFVGSFPAFNFADSYLTIAGVGLILFQSRVFKS